MGSSTISRIISKLTLALCRPTTSSKPSIANRHDGSSVDRRMQSSHFGETPAELPTFTRFSAVPPHGSCPTSKDSRGYRYRNGWATLARTVIGIRRGRFRPSIVWEGNAPLGGFVQQERLCSLLLLRIGSSVWRWKRKR